MTIKPPLFARLLLPALGMGILLSSCSSFSLQQVDYGWPVESVLKVKDDNTVAEGRYAIAFNVATLAMREFEDSLALRGKEIRLLRSNEGMYYITGQGFRHVYVMAPQSNTLRLRRKFEVSPTGLKRPAMNQRDPYVELVDGSFRVLMTSEDVYERTELRTEGR